LTISIDLTALTEWETGAPEPDPNTDPTFDADEQNWPPIALPSPWAMSIAELDSWNAYYRGRLRLQGRGCGALTADETTHRAEVEANINARHEARRHSAFTH
jgi:hypothetical protein